ncbi:hypothetical protein R1flu_003281 [Riccia fluitans]|uniref:RBR-type E3 ubiquitin transferase n=1 Tax=Riccia fluitans TaxID=41844 RepID=A0ABD1Y8K8_9MARC
MTDVVAVHKQLQELSMATITYSDWELAYNMQLEEAMNASITDMGLSTPRINSETGPGRDRRQDTGPSEYRDGVQHPASDLTSALQFQSQELLKLEQEIKDQNQAIEDAQRLMMEMRRRNHDVEFAKSVLEMSDEEWERVGDEFEKPFCKIDEDDWDDKQTCNLYTARAREDAGYVAIAWSLTDEDNRVLLEQSKCLGVDVPGYEADYISLLDGLAVAIAGGVKNIHVCCHSLTVYNQITGLWKAKSPKQVSSLSQALEKTKQLQDFSIELISKHLNAHTTSLAHEAIKKHIEVTLMKGAKNPCASSSSSQTEKLEDCPICFEKVPEIDTFEVKGCSHRFCLSCLTQHIQIRVKSSQVPVKCPQDCANSVDIDECRDILSHELLEAYAKRLTEASIPESERVYCPFFNCSSLMSKSDLTTSSEPSTSRQPKAPVFGRTECMECHRLFCAECRVPWHAEMTCEEYQSLPLDERDTEDIKLHKLADSNKWQRCAKCHRMIELDHGCYHMTCRCGHEFCYICGAPWVNKQATCKCKLWDEERIVADPLSGDEMDTDSEVDLEHELEDFLRRNPPRVMPRAYKTRMCRFWLSGFCRAGVLCNFAHGPEDLRFQM